MKTSPFSLVHHIKTQALALMALSANKDSSASTSPPGVLDDTHKAKERVAREWRRFDVWTGKKMWHIHEVANPTNPNTCKGSPPSKGP